ncbi:FadR/GntR family transcriptional regulator [Pararhizobium sp.]|uniref:FadR/GntR family transcriptional regulator n=1 Tax=Pararhizobium sp. TaxID=1977563 RepID=UPI002717612E|nr:FadR/GntR family transcriptional regulator [Pararhizobium sp.]MDO9418210.1 FadR/GntR family transcriptional regulator [Pararhizobium sp.]
MPDRFSQISRSEHLPARIASQIGREIADGRLGSGVKLPTEHELAKTFGVSRSVVREAIAQLRNEGMVETRQGVGAFVTPPQRRQTIRIESDTLVDPQSFRSLFQLRVPLEIESAGLAALHHTSAQLAKIDEALDQMSGIHKWTDEGIAADLAFHRAMAAATGNEYFDLVLGFIAERISSTISLARSRGELEKIIDLTIAEHAAIRTAVAARDAAAARLAMRAHILGAAARLSLDLDRE